MSRNDFIRFDWAAKRLLRQKSNFVVLEGLLSTLLNEPVKIVKMLESEGNREYEKDKFNRVDMLAENSRGELIIVEIQNNRELDYFHRILYGVSKIITEYMHLGEPYSNIKKIYSISIVYFDIGQGQDYVYHGRTEFKGFHFGDTLHLSAKQQKQFLFKDAGDLHPEYYILRLDDFDKKAETPLDEWISFLKTGDIPADAKAGGLPEARERLRVDKLNPEEKRAYYRDMETLSYQRSVLQTGMIEGRDEGREEGLIEGREEGLIEGIAKGRAEGIIEGRAEGKAEGEKEKAIVIARNALNKGLDLDMVLDMTNLKKEDLA
jgi:predicted transposase/invertase (TIGR01784 family)